MPSTSLEKNLPILPSLPLSREYSNGNNNRNNSESNNSIIAIKGQPASPEYSVVGRMPCPPVTGKGLNRCTQYVLLGVFLRSGNVPRCLVEEEMYPLPGKGIRGLCDDRNSLPGDGNCIQIRRKMRKRVVRRTAESLGLFLCPIVCTTLSIFFSLFRSPLYPSATQLALSAHYLTVPPILLVPHPTTIGDHSSPRVPIPLPALLEYF